MWYYMYMEATCVNIANVVSLCLQHNKCMHLYLITFTYIHVHVHVLVCTYTCMYIYMYMYVHVHTILMLFSLYTCTMYLKAGIIGGYKI